MQLQPGHELACLMLGSAQVLGEGEVLYNLMTAFQNKHRALNGSINGLGR